MGDDACAQSCSGDRLIPVTGLFRSQSCSGHRHIPVTGLLRPQAYSGHSPVPACRTRGKKINTQQRTWHLVFLAVCFFIALDLQLIGTGRYEICDGLCVIFNQLCFIRADASRIGNPRRESVIDSTRGFCLRFVKMIMKMII